MNRDRNRPIELEDLLRLKRAERPAAEFWTDFDRQLRAKQLAAIVAKRPWWQRMPNLFTGFTRFHLPLGAAAVLAVTFIALRDDPDGARSGSTGAAGQVAVAAVPAGVARVTAPVNPAESSAVPSRIEIVPAGNMAVAESAAAPLASEATAPGELATLLPSIGAPATEPQPVEPAASARYLTAALISPVSETNLGHGLLATPAVFATRSLARPAIEPLQQIASPGERARTRMLTAMVAMATTETPSRMGERTASRLDEDRLSDQMRRLDARGDRLILKF